MNDAIGTVFSELAAPVKPPFIAKQGDPAFALISFPAALLYTWVIWNAGNRVATGVLVALFTGLFLASGAYLNRRERATAESRIWLAGTVLLLAAVVFRNGRVWAGRELLFLHAFAVYWLMGRSGLLARAATSGFVWYDAFNAIFRIPLRNLTLRVNILWYALTRRERANKKAAWTLGAGAVGLGLFAYALEQLVDADEGFARILGALFAGLSVRGADDCLFRLALSIPVGAYLTGMFLGMNRSDKAAFAKETDRIGLALQRLKRVPPVAWTVIVSAFCALYALFFAVQGGYLFGAFAGRLPAEFTVAQYARQGFFELCKVMTVNFSLLLLAGRCTAGKPPRAILTALMLESVLLAATAMSKLGMYIGIFGFTALRLQSSWLAAVLLAGCVCAIVSLWTQKRTFRVWTLFATVALVLTCFY
jgi:hypothetical protein